jgi:hypothetical protein
MRKEVLRDGVHLKCLWQWDCRDEHKCSIRIEVNTLDRGQSWMRLSYTHEWQGEKQNADYRLRLTATRPRFGGLRWWFVCPLTVEGEPCRRRLAKLYLPPRCRFFGCRHCHDLTYTSCQKSHQNDTLYRYMAREMGWDIATTREAMERLSERWRHGS